MILTIWFTPTNISFMTKDENILSPLIKHFFLITLKTDIKSYFNLIGRCNLCLYRSSVG